jgi:nucleotide-binding universal stress UspA family protein
MAFDPPGEIGMNQIPPNDRPVQNILVPTDFSACSEKALQFAATIARTHRSRLTILHIVPPLLPPLLGVLPPVPRRSEALHAARDQMRQFEAGLRSKGVLREIESDTLIKRGEPWKVISKILRSQGSDLIVMGTHGPTGLKKLILGSFAEVVFRKAPCPVLTVGPRIPDQAVAESPQRILFPTDGSYVSKTAEPYAFQLGRSPGAELTLLGVVHRSFASNGRSAADRVKQATEGLRATGLYAAWREGGATPNIVVEDGSKVASILRAAEATDADVIILAISGEDANPEMFTWDDAYQVVCSASCPVLTVRHSFPDPYFKRLLQMESVGGRRPAAKSEPLQR